MPSHRISSQRRTYHGDCHELGFCLFWHSRNAELNISCILVSTWDFSLINLQYLRSGNFSTINDNERLHTSVASCVFINSETNGECNTDSQKLGDGVFVNCSAQFALDEAASSLFNICLVAEPYAMRIYMLTILVCPRARRWVLTHQLVALVFLPTSMFILPFSAAKCSRWLAVTKQTYWIFGNPNSIKTKPVGRVRQPGRWPPCNTSPPRCSRECLLLPCETASFGVPFP